MSGREHTTGAPAPTLKAGAAPTSRETGWLPDCVYTGDKFEAGLAFFADDLGRITRFSREPADLAAAKRLTGQAALPGLVNTHSQSWQRVLRGRIAQRPPAGHDPVAHAVGCLTGADIYDAARMAFMEMMLSGIACVGEFQILHHQPDGTPWPEPNFLSHEILRAARDTGLRLALFKAVGTRAGFHPQPEPVRARLLTPKPDQYIREVDALREFVVRNHPGEEAWVGVAAHSLGTVPLDHLKVVATYAHAQRLRLHIPVSEQPAENEACVAEYGRRPVALLAEHGLLDKRFTAIHAIHITEDEARLLGAARTTVCTCPTSKRSRGESWAPAAKLHAAGAALALGTDSEAQINLLEEARRLSGDVSDLGAAGPLFQVATAAGARSLGAPSGALEVGRPADFFTVNLYDPSIAGAEPDGLLGNIVFSLERRAIRDVWVGARQCVANGRHPYQGAIVSRFVELQRRLWGSGGAG
jgi:formimidoylglutamate deiminase